MTATFTIPRLESDRLILRAHQASDIAAEAAFYASPRAQYVGGPLSAEQTWRMIAAFLGHWALRGFGFWAIEDKSTGHYLGRAGLWFPAGWPEREIGWTLMEEAEGRGIALEAALAARAYAYDVLGWTTAISMTTRGNTRSAALAKRMGATLNGSFEHDRFGPCDIYRHPAPEALT
jgi:RimJ/RimL family protein N-acetyltransferase